MFTQLIKLFQRYQQTQQERKTQRIIHTLKTRAPLNDRISNKQYH